MPQCHLASHAIAVGVDMRGEHNPAAGREHRGDFGGRARALGGNRDSVRAHGIKINKSVKQRRHARASRKNVTQRRQARTSRDRKSTRLNSSHLGISYAVFCLKKKKKTKVTNKN